MASCNYLKIQSQCVGVRRSLVVSWGDAGMEIDILGPCGPGLSSPVILPKLTYGPGQIPEPSLCGSCGSGTVGRKSSDEIPSEEEACDSVGFAKKEGFPLYSIDFSCTSLRLE